MLKFLVPLLFTLGFNGFGVQWLRRLTNRRLHGINSKSAIPSQSIRTYKPRGLRNLGNTCYLNSIIQSLYHTDDVRDIVLSMEIDHKEQSIVSSLQRVFRRLNDSSESSPVDPSKLIQSCHIHPGIQEDAQEFLLSLLDKADSDSNTPISSCFAGKLQLIHECLQVNFTKSKTQRFIDLSVDITDKQNLIDSLLDYFDDELLTEDNRIKAGEYGKQDAVRKTSLLSAPENFVVSLKRFTYDIEADAMKKLHGKLEFSDSLDLGSMSLNGADLKYDLYGVVIHDGNPSYGHYTFFTRRLQANSDVWYYLNDGIVNECSFDHVKERGYGGSAYSMVGSLPGSCNAYLLFYKRRR